MDTVMQVMVLLIGLLILGGSKEGFEGSLWLMIPGMSLGLLFVGLALGGLLGIIPSP